MGKIYPSDFIFLENAYNFIMFLAFNGDRELKLLKVYWGREQQPRVLVSSSVHHCISPSELSPC